MQVIIVEEADMILQLALPMVTMFSSARGLQFSQVIFRITPPFTLPSVGSRDRTFVLMENVEVLDNI